jgi:chemotaxis protein MotB
MASTEPLGPNKTAAQRARNRRVEISIMQGKPYESDEVPVAQN